MAKQMAHETEKGAGITAPVLAQIAVYRADAREQVGAMASSVAECLIAAKCP